MLWAVGAPVAALVAYGAIDLLDSGDSLIATVPAGTRETFFGSLAATSGALLGFAITGLTILLSLGGGSRVKWLMRQGRFRSEARALFTATIASLGVATGVFLLLILVATDQCSFWAPWGYVTVATIALIGACVARLVLFFHDLMGIALKDAESDDRSTGKTRFTEPLDDN